MNSVQSTGHTGSMSKKDQIEVIVHFVCLFWVYRFEKLFCSSWCWIRVSEWVNGVLLLFFFVGVFRRRSWQNERNMIRCRFCEMSYKLQGIPIIKNIFVNSCEQVALRTRMAAMRFTKCKVNVRKTRSEKYKKNDTSKQKKAKKKSASAERHIVNLSVEISMQNTSEFKYDIDRDLNLVKHV